MIFLLRQLDHRMLFKVLHTFATVASEMACAVTVGTGFDVVLLAYMHDVVEDFDGVGEFRILMEVQLEPKPSTLNVRVVKRLESAVHHCSITAQDPFHVVVGEVVGNISYEASYVSSLPWDSDAPQFESMAYNFPLLLDRHVSDIESSSVQAVLNHCLDHLGDRHVELALEFRDDEGSSGGWWHSTKDLGASLGLVDPCKILCRHFNMVAQLLDCLWRSRLVRWSPRLRLPGCSGVVHLDLA